jgi:hypothetical protein
MPKTKFQSIIFTALMVFCMVFCMTVYTISLNSGVFDFQTFSLAIREMWLEYIVVFCLIFFLITNTSKKLAFRIIQPNCLPPIFTILSIQCFTVCQIVPVITLFATFVHNGITPDWFFQWIKLAVICFPMALCIQVFFAGPLVRFVFRALFKNN